jgi:hypothetical protein
MKKPVSKFAFQVHNLQRYSVALMSVFTVKMWWGCIPYKLNPVHP